ncbi:MAG: purine-binding chemotaxis protein CheW [Clostridiaceae bacterium]|nr:purine-binding chemotaxis protein CheW [Clostridiaceae bacterium]
MSTKQYVVFSIDGEEFGLSIENISSIEKMLEIFKIPNAPDYIEGLANLRSKVHTVFNLRKRFNLPSIEFDDDTKIIIVNTSSAEIGIIVDEVHEIVKVDEDQFSPMPSSLSNLKDRFLSGTAKVDDRLIMILDSEKVLSDKDAEDFVKAE